MADASIRCVPSATRRSEQSRRAALDAALALVTELPYPRITVDAIAARAGVSKATIYRWWSAKGALVVEALAQQSADRPEEHLVLPDTGDLEADLAGVLRAIVDEMADPSYDALMRALSIESLQDPALRDQVREQIFGVQLEYVERRFAAARAAGQLRDDVGTLEAFELFVAPVFHRWQGATGPLSHAYADGVAARAVRALRPD